MTLRLRIYLGEVGGVDACGNPPRRDGPHVGDEPLRRVEADDVDAAVGRKIEGQETLAEPSIADRLIDGGEITSAA